MTRASNKSRPVATPQAEQELGNCAVELVCGGAKAESRIEWKGVGVNVCTRCANAIQGTLDIFSKLFGRSAR
jgi:hypothetical protein